MTVIIIFLQLVFLYFITLVHQLKTIKLQNGMIAVIEIKEAYYACFH
ncbi:hypothetical protein [Streptococcus iniae]|nr:hypothetical protein [Streptococcus iniae]MCA1356963.1 hypothetical protein [Streptococcus iniae]